MRVRLTQDVRDEDGTLYRVGVREIPSRLAERLTGAIDEGWEPPPAPPPPAPEPEPEEEPRGGTVAELEAALPGIEDPAELDELEDAERGGKNRVTALEAIARRRGELEDAEEPEPEEPEPEPEE